MMSILKTRIERALVAIAAATLALTLMNMVVIQGFSTTEEEAIEVSRSSTRVRNWLEEADHYAVMARYLNRTQVNKAREEFPGLGEVYPYNRSVWTVAWAIHPRDAVSSFSYSVFHVIDGETARILYEGVASSR